jgi:hypothetical protein
MGKAPLWKGLIAIAVFGAILSVAQTSGSEASPAAAPAKGSKAGKQKAENDLPFSGVWKGTYKSNQAGETKITVMLQQYGNFITGTYLTGEGTQGVIYGTVASDQAKLTADQKTPACVGHFAMDIKANNDHLSFSFKGQHCAGVENGTGNVAKATS